MVKAGDDIAARTEERIALETELKYQREVERALRKENRRRLLAEKIVRKQTQALVASLSLAVGRTSPSGFIRALLRAITRECGGLFATYWDVSEQQPPQVTRSVSFFLDQATEKTVERYAEAHPAQIERIARLYQTILGEERALTAVKAKDRRYPAETRRLFAQVGVESVLLAPLLLGPHLLGWISFLSVEPARKISAGHLAFIEATSHQAALSLYLARLSVAERQRALTEERNRIARDMHDLLAQSFSGIILQCEALRAESAFNLPVVISERVEKIRLQAMRGIEEVRRSLSMSRPALLENGGLVGALSVLVAEADAECPSAVRFIHQAKGIQINCKVEVQLFAIASEALHNAMQHAQAGFIDILLKCTKHQLILSICDDGQGFEPFNSETTARQRRFGLSNMRERAKSLPARFALESKLGKGTAIQVTMDLSDQSGFEGSCR